MLPPSYDCENFYHEAPPAYDSIYPEPSAPPAEAEPSAPTLAELARDVSNNNLPAVPNYARSAIERLLDMNCVNCDRNTPTAVSCCNHAFCFSCIEHCFECPVCKYPIDEYSSMMNLKLKTGCGHFLTVGDVMTFIQEATTITDHFKCITCAKTVNDFSVVHDQIELTYDAKRMKEYKESVGKNVADELQILKVDCIARRKSWDPVLKLFSHFQRQLLIRSPSYYYNARGRCGYCTKNAAGQGYGCETECCKAMICKYCVRNMAEVIGDVKQRCPICKSKKFLKHEGGDINRNSALYVYLCQLEKERRFKEMKPSTMI